MSGFNESNPKDCEKYKDDFFYFKAAILGIYD